MVADAASLLIEELHRLGVELRPRGERLAVRPRSALTPDLRDRLRANKAEVLRRLYRERVKAAVRRVHATDPRLAEAMVDSWMERIAIVEADGGDPIEAERIACEQAEREADTLRGESVDEWAGRVIHDDLDGRGERNLF